MRLRATALAALLGLAIPSIAPAASRVVVVDDATRSTREATARLRAELVAAGFDVESRAAKEADAERDVESEGNDSVATVRLTRDPATHRTELWVSDRLTGKTLVRRVNADPEKNPRLVAIRGVELLRASLLEIESPPHDDAPPVTPALAQPPPPEIAKLVAPPPAPVPPPESDVHVITIDDRRKRAHWADRATIDAGAVMLVSTEGLGAAFAPAIGASFPLTPKLDLRPRLAGPAFRSGIQNAAGSADTRQELVTLDLAWAPLDGPVVPFVALGGGAYHLRVDGHPATPAYHAASDDVWAAVLGGGLGLDVVIAPSIAIAIEGRALAITPHPQVAIGNERVAATGAPMVLASASLVAAF